MIIVLPMSETIIWKTLEPLILEEGGDCCRHEDKYKSGIPDISYGLCRMNGWIESKFLDAWPKKLDTIVRFNDFPEKQRRWLSKRDIKGGNCYVILLVGRNRKTREFLVFRGKDCSQLGNLTRGKLHELALFSGNNLGGILDYITRF